MARWTMDEPTVLVFYGLRDQDDEPAPATPSLISREYLGFDPDNTLFIADVAPNISVEMVDELRHQILPRFKDPKLSSAALTLLERLDRWLDEIEYTGRPWVAFQLEPATIAGDGTARARALAEP